MNRLSLFLILLSAALFGFAECTCCGTNNGQGCCGADLAASIVSNCQQACSSNCVSLTPEACLQMKEEVDDITSRILQNASGAYDTCDNIYDLADSSLGDVNIAKINIINALTALNGSSVATASQYIQTSLSQMVGLYTRWRTVDGGLNDGLFVSNIVTHSTTRISGQYKISSRIEFVTNSLYSALAALHDDSTNNSAVVAFLTESLSRLSALSAYPGEGGALREILDLARNGKTEFESVQEDAQALRSSVSALNCEPCGKSSGGGGGGDDGGSGNLDLTPVVEAVSALQKRLDYWMDKFNYLMKKLFEDYNNADSPVPFTAPSYGAYQALDDNWFRRVEYLLYAVAYQSLTNDVVEAVPDEPDGWSDIEYKNSQIKDDAESSSAEVSDTFRQSVSAFRESLERLTSRLARFAPSSQGDLGSPILSFEHGASSWALRPMQDAVSEGNGVGSTIAFTRRCFAILWKVLVALLYFYCLFFFVRFVLRCVALVYKAVFDSLS